VKLNFRDGTSFEKEVVVHENIGVCCPGLYGNHVDLPGSFSDAGPSSGE
jgi:hypothetical protein